MKVSTLSSNIVEEEGLEEQKRQVDVKSIKNFSEDYN